MINLKDLLELWGFSSHPFESYTAENEPRLSEYFVPPPYLDDMIGSASSMTPAIVFGSRGIGKSAIRIHIENICSAKDSEQRVGGRALAITYDDFSKAVAAGIDNVSLERHLEAILNKAVVAALAVIANTVGDQSKVTEDTIEESFPDLDIPVFSRLVQKYFIRREAISITDRIHWFHRLWGVLRVPLIDIANLFQAARGKDGIKPVQIELLGPREENNAELFINDLYTIAGITEQLGFDGWYILIDKVDEDEHTDSDATKAAKLIAPLLKNLRILELNRIGFKFFLWNQLRAILIEERVRLDKIRNLEMSWTRDELKEMIDRRLKTYSGDRVSDLLSITEDDAHDIYETAIYYSMFSPRELAHILDSIFREHARHSDQDTGTFITRASIDRGVDDYCLRRIKDIYSSNVVRTIARLPDIVFTSGDVQSMLRVSKQAASARISKWTDDGYIERTEDARSETDPSKSIYQYIFREKRFERVVQRKLYTDPISDEPEEGTLLDGENSPTDEDAP